MDCKKICGTSSGGDKETEMNAKHFLNYIKQTGMTFRKYTLGTVEEEVSDSLCLYKRSGTAGAWEYDKNHSTVYPVGIVYTGTKNYTETEQKIEELFQTLVFTLHQDLEDTDIIFSVMPHNDSTPRFLGKNEAGFYQWAIDFDLHTD